MDASTRAAIVTACEENYSGYTQDALEVELVRQIKMGKTHQETRKDYMSSYKELVDECDLKIDYIIGKIDTAGRDGLEAEADEILAGA